ncbi:hypothetical protein [Comamonas sp. MYb396]|uniref:hypothetical protein n=1 Tax=Comamonas sp. MYb396 TaxID=2745302 RepID=UPI00309FB83E
MTTPDPSREAYHAWLHKLHEDDEIGPLEDPGALAGWIQAERYMQAELQQAHESRRQAQTELAAIQEKCNRIGLDIDWALRGEVNEQSPIAGRLKLIADSAAQSVAKLRQDAIALNLMRHVGLDKHVARECEQIVRQLLQPAAPKQEGST